MGFLESTIKNFVVKLVCCPVIHMDIIHPIVLRINSPHERTCCVTLQVITPIPQFVVAYI